METLDHLIAAIEADARATAGWTGRDHFHPRVLHAMRKVDRARFIPADARDAAHENLPLKIGHGQTISQPFIVALMTDLLDLQPSDAVLEIGTGSGYQTAILAELAHEVCSVEVIPELAARAATVLAELGYSRVALRAGDGKAGWPERAPFDAIIVTAAGREVPPALTGQLKAGGRMVIPVGKPHGEQQLRLIRKNADGTVDERTLLPVAFVPLTGSRPI